MKIPGLSKWAMHAGGTAGGGKHGYTFTTGPWPANVFHIDPVTNRYGRFIGYHLQVTPGIYHSVFREDLGMFRSPQAAAKHAGEIFKDNPLTRRETKNVLAEADVHRRITGRRPEYYRGMADGMKDIAEEYGRNPVTVRRLPSGGYRVSHGGKVSAFSTTKEKAEAQARLLRGVEHGMIPRGNPAFHLNVEDAVKIYNRVIEIRASKEGMPHYCDAKCKAANHLYKHGFRKKACIYGLPDGSLLIR